MVLTGGFDAGGGRADILMSFCRTAEESTGECAVEFIDFRELSFHLSAAVLGWYAVWGGTVRLKISSTDPLPLQSFTYFSTRRQGNAVRQLPHGHLWRRSAPPPVIIRGWRVTIPVFFLCGAVACLVVCMRLVAA